MAKRDDAELPREERRQLDEHGRPPARLVHEVIRLEGKEELERDLKSLWWSALAAGLSVGFSMIAKALIAGQLIGFEAAGLIVPFGYSVGFVIVVLGREQLFTENTITAILPLVHEKTWGCFLALLRLWGIVLLGNLVGCALFALVISQSAILDARFSTQLAEQAFHLIRDSFWITFGGAIFAGWLIAAMVWLMPGAKRSEVLVVILITYFIGLGGFAHIIVGSAEVFFLLFEGQVGILTAIGSFFIPALIGNVVGGSTLFALISHAQVSQELADYEKHAKSGKKGGKKS